MSRGSMESSTTQTVPRDLRRRSMRYGKQIKTNRDRLLLCGRRVASRPTSVVAARCLQRRPDTISRCGKDRKLIEPSGSFVDIRGHGSEAYCEIFRETARAWLR